MLTETSLQAQFLIPMLISLATGIIFSSFIINCENDSVRLEETEPESELNDAIFQSEYFGDQTSGNFIGLVTNASNQKLAGVEISIGDEVVEIVQNNLNIAHIDGGLF